MYAALEDANTLGWAESPIRPVDAVVVAQWGAFARPFYVGSTWIGWPKALADLVTALGPLDTSRIAKFGAALEAGLPPA